MDSIAPQKCSLQEVFGYPVYDSSRSASLSRNNALCPFSNRVPNCTKDRAADPLGVCSILDQRGRSVIVCPVRFRQNWLIVSQAAQFFFPEGSTWTTLTEIRINEATGVSAGNIDVLLCSYDKDNGKLLDFGALEIQAVYISGNIRNAFKEYITQTKNNNFKCNIQSRTFQPDFLSSSRKRLAPQLLYKGHILNKWGKKIAVALDLSFFETLPKLKEVPIQEADMAIFVYNISQENQSGHLKELVFIKAVYVKFSKALNQITIPQVGKLDNFIEKVQKKLDKKITVEPNIDVFPNPFE